MKGTDTDGSGKSVAMAGKSLTTPSPSGVRRKFSSDWPDKVKE